MSNGKDMLKDWDVILESKEWRLRIGVCMCGCGCAWVWVFRRFCDCLWLSVFALTRRQLVSESCEVREVGKVKMSEGVREADEHSRDTQETHTA
jgi:hypothetical protein